MGPKFLGKYQGMNYNALILACVVAILVIVAITLL